jgi:hypothetical protein
MRQRPVQNVKINSLLYNWSYCGEWNSQCKTIDIQYISINTFHCNWNHNFDMINFVNSGLLIWLNLLAFLITCNIYWHYRYMCLRDSVNAHAVFNEPIIVTDNRTVEQSDTHHLFPITVTPMSIVHFIDSCTTIPLSAEWEKCFDGECYIIGHVSSVPFEVLPLSAKVFNSIQHWLVVKPLWLVCN